MIVTAFYVGQGLGNQLWVYATCRSIADKLQLPHAIVDCANFKGGSFLEIDYGEQGRLPPRGSSSEVVYSYFHERIFYDQELDYFASDFDSSVLGLRANTILHGLFQSEDYFFGNLALPRKYVTVNSKYLRQKLVPDDCCVLNLRGGEYKRHKNLILPKSYWQNAMRNMRERCGIDRFTVVTDDHKYAAAMFPGLPVLQSGVAESYIALYQARYVILSNTSFAYFPVKTGLEKALVIAPMHWARFGNRYSRWASPANLYDAWIYQDVNGLLHSYADCVHQKEKTIAYYRDHYYLSTVASAVMKPGILAHIPTWVKRPIKKGLSVIFPRRIG